MHFWSEIDTRRSLRHGFTIFYWFAGCLREIDALKFYDKYPESHHFLLNS